MDQVYPDMQSDDDKMLILRIQQGDNDAFTLFYERHRTSMYLSAYHLLKDEDNAHDAVQELFMKVWQSAAQIDPASNIKGYLYTILRNRILSNMSRSKYFEKYVNSYLAFEQQYPCSTEETVLVRELQHILEDKIAKLPPKMREVYELSWDGQLSNKEIAEKLNISEGTVKQHKHQATRILRSKFPRLLLFAMLFCN